MGAADSIRAGKLEKYKALEKAGMNISVVEIMLMISRTGAKEYAGKQGERTFLKLTIKPNPEVVFSRQVVQSGNGLQDDSHAQLKGAFPGKLAGFQIVLGENNTQISSVATEKVYADPKAFRVDLEKADYFLIDGEKYKYRAGGFVNIDKTASEWKLKLVRTDSP